MKIQELGPLGCAYYKPLKKSPSLYSFVCEFIYPKKKKNRKLNYELS